MENQSPPNFYKRRLAAIFVFAIFFIFLGRHMTFLPTINLSENPKELDLKNGLERFVKNKNGFYSIYYKDLKTNNFIGIDEKQIQTGASVNKLPIVAVLYYLDSQGKIDLDEKITVTEENIQDYGTGSLRYQKMPQSYSLRNLAKLSLKESDNTAAHVLSIKIGTDVIQKTINSWGLKQTNMADNKTTAYDMGVLLEKIYRNEIASEAKTNELFEFMTDTNFEDRIPAKLPNNAKTYHKTGDGEGFVHDVGIVETEKGVYILGVMTSDIGSAEKETKAAISDISKKVFEELY